MERMGQPNLLSSLWLISLYFQTKKVKATNTHSMPLKKHHIKVSKYSRSELLEHSYLQHSSSKSLKHVSSYGVGQESPNYGPWPYEILSGSQLMSVAYPKYALTED